MLTRGQLICQCYKRLGRSIPVALLKQEYSAASLLRCILLDLLILVTNYARLRVFLMSASSRNVLD